MSNKKNVKQRLDEERLVQSIVKTLAREHQIKVMNFLCGCPEGTVLSDEDVRGDWTLVDGKLKFSAWKSV